MSPSGRLAFVIAILAAIGPPTLRGGESHPVVSPADYRLHSALEMSLFAREPDVVDPVALTFDELGRAFVVEMRDFPYGFGPDRKPGGTIRLLEDTDGDGRADRSSLFAEGLSFPTSVTAWDGGILVMASPEILFLKDTNGDGKADVREAVVSGFRLGVTDSNASGLRFALDNWIHCVNGGNGGGVRTSRKAGVTVSLGDRDFRFRPGTGDLELTMHTGGGFGLAFDDWGHSFTPHNVNHMQQRIADADWFARFPGLPAFDTTHSISDHGEMARIYAISAAVTRPNHPEQAGHFSASGGMGFIGHGGWPDDLPGSVFVCDVVGNLVHRDVLEPDGPIFKARRAPAEQTSEFFASRDPAFRPVGLEAGPDGALYVLDMQRDVIEHPDYIPKKLLEKLDLRAGEDRGRIYRIAPKGWPRTRELPGRASTDALVAMLGSPNQWTRLTAQRLLVTRAEKSVVPALRALVHATNPPPAREGSGALHRLHAMATLDGLGALDDETLLASLGDSTAGLRAHAIQLAAPRIRSTPGFDEKIEALLADPDADVRFRAALAAGERRARLSQGLVDLLKRDHAYRWTRRAVLSSLGPEAHALVPRLFADASFWIETTQPKLDLAREVAGVMAATTFKPASASAAAVEFTLPALASLPAPVRIALLEGATEGLRRRPDPVRDVPAETRRSLDSMVASSPPPGLLAPVLRVRHALGLPNHETEAPQLAMWRARTMDAAVPVPERVEMVKLLGVADFKESGPTLATLLRGSEPTPIQQAALEVLREHREPEVGETLVKAWPALSPSLRPAVVNLLVYRAAFHEALLAALEAGTLQVGELNLDLEHRRQLLRHAKPEIRKRAAAFTSDEEYSNRRAAVDEWLAKLPANGDPARGGPVFERLCAQCHRAGSLGFNVGPELTGMSHRSVEDLLSNILDPNMAMNPAYVGFTAELSDGESETGILESETGDTVTLVQAGERRVTLPRSKLKELRSSGRSLMPEGLEAGLQPADLRDVIAFLQETPRQGVSPHN